MRKVTQKIVEAFYRGEAKASGNTCTDGTSIWLHGNKIAEKDELGNFPQWPSPHIYQKNFTWYLSVGQRTLEFPCNGWVSVESEIDKAYKHEAVQ